MKKFTQQEIQDKIRAHIRVTYDTQVKAAKVWGIEYQALNDVVNGKTKPYDWLLEEIGFERHVPDEYYVRKGK